MELSTFWKKTPYQFFNFLRLFRIPLEQHNHNYIMFLTWTVKKMMWMKQTSIIIYVVLVLDIGL